MEFDPDHVRHVDHEMVHVLVLHCRLEHPRRPFPRVIRGTMRTAWASHYRCLMEFFHGRRKDKPPHPEAIRYCSFPGIEPEDSFGGWGHEEWMRVKHADALSAHLGARDKHGPAKGREWGEERDLRLIYPKVLHAMEHVTGAEDLFPKTARALEHFPCSCLPD